VIRFTAYGFIAEKQRVDQLVLSKCMPILMYGL